MKKNIVYTDEPMGNVKVIADFFKLEASKHQTQYQRMIRRLLDSYVAAQRAGAKHANRHDPKSV